jgi:DNA-binding response OmpR family regulator
MENILEGKKILFAEDDVNLGAILAERLKQKGFKVIHCSDGEKALKEFKNDKFDLLILDIMMPLKDGFSLAREIRVTDENTPIIFVTARSLKEDVIKGFQSGGDDYITKPFSMEELLMRIQAVLRRTSSRVEKVEDSAETDIFEFSEVVFNSVIQSLQVRDQTYKLTSKESELLKILCNNMNEVVPRDVALRKIWGDDTYFNGRSMDVFISKLRKLMKDDARIEIMNVHGKGFKLVVLA